MNLSRYSGAGNDFFLLDGRGRDTSAYSAPDRIKEICRGVDGFIILKEADGADFAMEYYNPDGSGGMMCGNGGRCVVSFARDLGIAPAADGIYRFLAPDGIHTARILSEDGPTKIVCLSMRDVHGLEVHPDGLFLNTGTRHFVVPVPSVEDFDVDVQGRRLRWQDRFAPEGTNVNFVAQEGSGLAIRTFEKGVEGETLACGTGITASAVAAFVRGIRPDRFEALPDGLPGLGRMTYRLRARIATLEVSFIPAHPAPSVSAGPAGAPVSIPSFHVRDITLTGPADRVPV